MRLVCLVDGLFCFASMYCSCVPCVCVCVRACVRACVPACVPACVCLQCFEQSVFHRYITISFAITHYLNKCMFVNVSNVNPCFLSGDISKSCVHHFAF